MSFPAYPRYKNSGIPWLCTIPEDWRLRKFRYIFRESGEKIESEVVGPMLSVSGYRGVEVKEYDDENRRRSFEDLVGYRIVRAGQLVVNTMWLNYAGLGVSAHEGHVSPAYRAYWFDHGELLPRFAHHLMRSQLYVQGYTQLLTGIRPNSLQMSREDLMNFPILLPPIRAQAKIAAFIDQETAKIDALVEQQQKLIALLKEKRQTIISDAVTRGLNSNAAMKNSDIDWLGQVPAHWKISRLKFHLSMLTSGSRGWGDFYADEGPIFIRIGNLTRESIELDLSDAQRVNVSADAEGARTRLRPGDVLFSITAYLGSVAVVPASMEEAYVSQHVALCRLRKSAPVSRWIAYVAASIIGKTHFDLRAYGGTKIQLSLDDVASLPVTIPPHEEQVAIVNWIDAETGKIARLEIECERVIEILKERRAALISDSVTGRIDIGNSDNNSLSRLDRAHARGLIAAEIIERSAGNLNFGRVKLQKVAYLAEAHVGITEIGGVYAREAAGPLDRDMISDMESKAAAIAGIHVDQPGGVGTAVTYTPSRQRGAHREDLASLLRADRIAKLDKLIHDMSTLDTKAAEAIATLYAVWNDALIEGEKLTDDEIITGFLSEWHPEKSKKFRAHELHEWLGWMRRRDLVPTGSGPKTTMGRLFA